MNYFSKKNLHRTLTLGLTPIAVMMISLSGCKKSNPLTGGVACDSFVKSSEAFSNAILAFSGDPSVANCQKMKNVGEEYWNAAKRCPTISAALMKEAEEGWAEWRDMDCTEYAENGN